MKKIILVFILLTGFYVADAQRNKEFQIRLGLGGAVYGTTTEFTTRIGAFSYTAKDDDGAVTFHLPLELRYELSERFNLGLDFKLGSYLYDPDSAEGKANIFFSAGIGAEYTFISAETFRLYGGVGFNSTALALEEDAVVLGIPVTTRAVYRGGGAKINCGVMWFFGGPFGLNANLGLDTHNFTLKSFEQNGQEWDLSNFDGKLTVKGVDVALGLVVRL